MSGVNIPVDSTHLSDQAKSEMIEQYGGAVDSQFARDSIMRRFFSLDTIRGTDTKIVRRVGKTALQAVTPGVRPAATATGFGRVGVTVDTLVLARNNRSQLNEFQTDFNARVELGRDHGKEIAKFFDQAFLIQGIKGAHAAAPTGLGGAQGAGRNEALALAGDEQDPDKLYAKIEGITVEMDEDDLPINEMAIFVRPTQYQVLVNNDKLVNRDFSMANGDFADGTIGTINGVPVVKTSRIPKAAIAGHLLSNADNGNAYDVSAAEAKTVALILHPKSLLAGETISKSSDVFFDKVERQWFIDSFLAFGVSVRRPEVCGAVLSA